MTPSAPTGTAHHSTLPAPLPALLCAAVAALLAGCNGKPSDPSYPGYAEAEYVRLSSPVSGTLARLHLQRGDQAAAGAPAFVLEQDSERAAREEATSRVLQAQAQLDNLKKGKRPDEVAAIQAQIAQADATAKLSADELARQRQLLAAKFVAPSRLDEARAASERDQARGAELRAQLRMSQSGARPDETKAAVQAVRVAEAQLAQAEWRLAQKTLRVPAAAGGLVADALYREGEWVSAGSPVLSLLPAANIKARFFVPESALGSLAPGQPVLLSCDGCSGPIPAKISYISREAEYTAPLIYSKENRAKLVFMLEARPDPENARRLHPGQPLEVRLLNGPVPGRRAEAAAK